MCSKLTMSSNTIISHPIYIIHYTVYIIHYTVYNTHYTVYIIQYTLYIIHYTLYIIQYTRVACVIVGAIHDICTRYLVHSILCAAHVELRRCKAQNLFIFT